MKVIGVTGKKRHGKDSIGQHLARFGFSRYAFADKVKDVGDVLLGLPVGSWRRIPDEAKESPITIPGWEHMTWRTLWQKVGTEMGRAIDPDVWVRATFSEIRASKNEYVVITDVRFPNEARAIRDSGGHVLKVVRPGFSDGDAHASELGVDEIVPDSIVWNDKGLEELQVEIDSLLDTMDLFGPREVAL